MSDIEYQARIVVEDDEVASVKAFVFRIDPLTEEAIEEALLSFTADRLKELGVISYDCRKTTVLLKGDIAEDAYGKLGEVHIDLSLSRCEP